jgi:hypothetical protein
MIGDLELHFDLDLSEAAEKIYQEEKQKFILAVAKIWNENNSSDTTIETAFELQYLLTKTLISQMNSNDFESYLASRLLDDLPEILKEAHKQLT